MKHLLLWVLLLSTPAAVAAADNRTVTPLPA